MKKASKQNLLSTIWLILFFPIGLYKMWRYSTYSFKTKVTISSIFLGIGLLTWAGSNPTKEVKTQTQSSLAGTRSVATVAPEELDRQRLALEDAVYALKFKKLNLLRAEVRVRLVRWNGFYLMDCEVNTSGRCGLYEVIKTDGGSEVFWVNGKAAGVTGQRFQKSPNVNVKYDISDAIKAVKEGK